MYHSEINSQDLDLFLKYIGFGEQDKAEAMLRKNPDLALWPGKLIDCAERQFKQITGFQYAVWALDWHMWNMVKKYMPEEEIKKQLIMLETEDWIKEHGSQVSWKNLTDALSSYLVNYYKWNWDQREAHWCKQIGKAQLTLPAHVINEYSRHDRSFNPCPDFSTLQKLPRVGCDTWKNSDGHILGQTIAWVRSGKRDRMYGRKTPRPEYVMVSPAGCPSAAMDRLALVALSKIRIEQRAQFLSSVTLDTKPKFNP